jgi:serine/threonine protein kinase/tetratricopeptide (TPR) repeat protein
MTEPGMILGGYRIERLLGRGGMGAVYLGYDTTLHRPVALKVVDGSAERHSSRTRLVREARNAAALNHPNICTIHEVRDDDDSAFIAMEYVEGRSLRQRLDDGPIPVDDAVCYGLQAADALAYAHAHGVIHRDFKAANVIVTPEGRLKIVDFGLARRDDPLAADATTLESAVPRGAAAGTPYAMAPEQVRGDCTDACTDIWALGVLLYEMVTGAKPFNASTTPELFASILRDAPAPVLAAVPARLNGLILACLAKNPNARGTARDLCDGLKEVESQRKERTPAQALVGDSDVTLTAGSRRRILVLPFANISPDRDTEYFADGLTEELIADLSHMECVVVISRTSAMRFKARTKDLRTIARELGVDLVLDGSVRKAKGSLRIAAQLIDTRLDASIWADRFTGADADVFDLQERLSRQIVGAMGVTLTDAETARLSERPIGDPRVYDLYLRARQKLTRFSAQDLDDAVVLLREGLELLGENELLRGTLGHAYIYYINWGVRPDARYLEEVQRCADAVFGLRPDSSHGHSLLGGLEVMRGNLQDAVRHLKRAIAVDSGNAQAVFWLVYCYLTAGQPRSARPLIERELRIDPLSAVNHSLYGWLKIGEGNPEEAVRHYQRACELDPSGPASRAFYGWALAQAGRRREAADYLLAFAKDVVGSVIGELNAGLGNALAGDGIAAHNAIGPLSTNAAQHDAALAHGLSEVYALAGDYDEAFRWLERAVRRGYLDYPFLASVDPLYEGFRADERFVRLMSDVQRRWQAFEV